MRSRKKGFWVQFERAVNPDDALQKFTYEWQVVHAPCGVGFDVPAVAFPLGSVADGVHPNSPDSSVVMARSFTTPLSHGSRPGSGRGLAVGIGMRTGWSWGWEWGEDMERPWGGDGEVIGG